jgi:hypothetical protein
MGFFIHRFLLISSLITRVISSPVQSQVQLQSEKFPHTAFEIDPKTGEEKYDLEPKGDYAFAGITTFFKLPTKACLTSDEPSDDILVVGLPFDTATSYRSGTRFGPNAIRQGSRAAALM